MSGQEAAANGVSAIAPIDGGRTGRLALIYNGKQDQEHRFGHLKDLLWTVSSLINSDPLDLSLPREIIKMTFVAGSRLLAPQICVKYRTLGH